VAATVVLTSTASAYYPPPEVPDGGKAQPNRTFRLDGKFVHNVGRLHLQLTNIGQTGNANNPRLTTVPSAEYPPGSGYDHLYAAGLWIGAIDASGIPHVTTAAYEVEYSPETEPQDVCVPLPLDQVADVREAYEGIPGGNRVISASQDPDDDGDGRVDEDFLNGIDDDLDGLCDEDYSAIGQQMFSTEYRDDIPSIRQINPEHVPLGVRVRQTSYAWSTPGQSDFVGMDYQITNLSGRSIRNVYVAIFADPDVGSRAIDNYFLDDHCALFDSTVTYVGASGEEVRRRIQMAYAYDNPDNPNRPQDNKGGDVPGYFGCMFLNHTVDPTGVNAPPRVGITAFKFFSGSASFAAGGDPENDAQRYQLLSDPRLNPNSPAFAGNTQSSRPLDYRFIMATGPFRQILPDSTLTVSVAWVAGIGLGRQAGNETPGTLIANAKSAQQVFDGLYADLDNDQLTGQCGKETCIRNTTGGRAFTYEIPDSACIVRFHENPADEGYPQFDSWQPAVACQDQQEGKYVCIDQLANPGPPPTSLQTHCASRDTVNLSITSTSCTYVDFDCDVNTGLGGRERLVNWVAAAPLPAPFFSGVDGQSEPSDFLPLYSTTQDSVRVSAWFFPGDNKITLKWSDFAEQIRDAQRGNLKEFVGYRVYKAAGWNRPEGTNAPSRDLWMLLGEWRKDPKGTSARNLAELIDPSAPIISTNSVQVRWDPELRRATNDSTKWTTEIDTLHAIGRYSFVDPNVLNGFPYFYSIVPVSVVPGETAATDAVLSGNPSATNSQVVYPRGDAKPTQEAVYVVPNPYKANAEWDLVPREEDPSGTKVLFMNLPATKGTVHVYTLAGDLVIDLPFDGTVAPDMQFGKDPVLAGKGSIPWNLISRNGQKIVSGIYMYSVDTEELGRQVGKFVVIR
jgi:hypothetical protein